MTTGGYEVDVTFTTHHVPHIRAANWGSLGFGQGWACARDHLPTIADQVVKVRSERAKYHGAGPDDDHIASDFGYRMLGLAARADAFHDAQTEQIQELVTGYTAGINHAVEQLGDDWELPAWCRDAPWIRRISEADLYGHLVDVTLMASGRNLATLIGRAEAPDDNGPRPASPGGEALGAGYASNGWAFGRDVTASGRGVVMANPHFPWTGEGRFWECHLTIPGEIDVYGGSLVGAPGVHIGFNRNVAWTHTFSAGNRMALYSLDLVPDAPTAYRFGDEQRDMTSEHHVVQVLGDDGSLTDVARTLWRSHHGPMVNLPLLGWGLENAWTYRDANIENTKFLEQFLGMDTAGSMADFKAAFETAKGMPWANTMAADDQGDVWYVDASATPNLSDRAQTQYRERLEVDFIAALLAKSRIAVLNGSDPTEEWQVADGARDPGLLPHHSLPQLDRTDWVSNSNDSHWLTNTEAPLEGYSVLCGFEGTSRSLRTRQNILTCQALASAGDVTARKTLDALFSNASLSADLLLDDVIARCRAAGTAMHEDHEIDVAAAAEVLAAWDRAYDLDSVGAVVWREFMSGFTAEEWRDAGRLFTTGFSSDAPATTPARLAPADEQGADHAVAAMAAAVAALTTAGIALDTPLGDVQWALRGDTRVAVHGGGEGEGLLNVLAPNGALPDASLDPKPVENEPTERTGTTGLRHGGYRVTYGTSIVLAIEFTDDGPRAEGLLAYGQSGDPDSPHHVDGTEAYRDKATRPILFETADIEACPDRTEVSFP